MMTTQHLKTSDFSGSVLARYTAIASEPTTQRSLLRDAYRVARGSPHPRTQVGAILRRLADSRTVARTNAPLDNYHPRPANIPQEVWDDYAEFLAEHAERAVLFAWLAEHFAPLTETVMVAPWAACANCARAIVGFGVPAVLAHRQAFDRTSLRWKHRVDAGRLILRAAGVGLIEFNGRVGDCENLMDGEVWEP